MSLQWQTLLKFFDCLESHGADLEVRDTTGRNIIGISVAIKLVGVMWGPDKSLFDNLMKRHESY
jgi:hypothetical protein